jgi:hypothetical protein
MFMEMQMFSCMDFELVLEEEEDDGEEVGEGGGLGGSSPSSLLSCLEYSPWKGLFHSKQSSYNTFTILDMENKVFCTLYHSKTCLLLMPSPHFEKYSFSIQSMDPLLQDHLHYDSDFPW